jgi:DNA-directed RNA polymerase subunit RPC12/RpoP
MDAIIMIEDAPYYDPYAEQNQGTSSWRWLAFGVILILGVVSTGGVLFIADPAYMFFVIIFMFPLVIFLIYAAYRWAQGRPIVVTNVSQDEEIFSAMRRHALPAEQVGGLEMYRCPDCQITFELANATPVEDKVVLCPTCGARLFIG